MSGQGEGQGNGAPRSGPRGSSTHSPRPPGTGHGGACRRSRRGAGVVCNKKIEVPPHPARYDRCRGRNLALFAMNSGAGKVRHSMRWHHDFSNLATITTVLSFLLAVTGFLDLPITSAQENGPGGTSHSITASNTEDSESVGLRLVFSGDTVVAADQDQGQQPVPSPPDHCPMNLGLSVACPDVLSSAVHAASVPVAPGSTPAAVAAAQPAGALPEVPGAPLHPVSLIRLSISRV